MKRLIAVACGVAALGFGASAADAAPRPDPILLLEPSPVAPGGRFTAVLENYCDGDYETPIDFQVAGGVTAVATCGVNNLAIASLTAPSTPGEYQVRADLPETAVVALLTVQAGVPGPDEPLPDTGLEHTLAVSAVGGGLLVAGIVLCATARARRPSAP